MALLAMNLAAGTVACLHAQPLEAETASSTTSANTSGPAAIADDLLFPRALGRSVERQAATLERLQKAVERLKQDDVGLDQQRNEIEQLGIRISGTKSALEPLLANTDKQIAQIGPKPKAGESTAEDVEAPELIKERVHLANIRSRIIAAQKRSDLSAFRSKQLIQRIQVYQLSNFTAGVLKRSDSPLSVRLWRNILTALPRVGTQLNTVADSWWATAKLHFGLLPITMAIAALLYVALVFLRRRVVGGVLREPMEPRPGFVRRVMTTSWLIPIIAMPGAVVALALFAGGDLLGIWDGLIRAFVHTSLIAFLVFSAITALATGLLQPRRPSWRLVGIPDVSARRLLWATNLIAFVYATDYFLHNAIRLFHMPVAIGVVETSFANIAFAGLLVMFALTTLPDGMSRISGRLLRTAFYWLRIPLFLAALAIFVSTVLGYVALGRFIAGQVMLMGAGGIVVLLVHLAIRALTTQADSSTQPDGDTADEQSLISTRRRQQLSDLIAILLNVVLGFVVVFLLLLSWGFPLSQLLDGLKALLFGFEIGQFRISLVRILIGVGLFIAVLFTTRLVQRWLDRSVLASPKLDKGIANSLHTGIGYLGMGIAGLIGISYAGIDLTQLTVVIGALSLGIGLGLQSIVNNFVSGLILLVERPVKVGDWVVIGSEQGYIRKISVRATEIETFDRASVIIPNSELISGTVQNWTHRNAMGRIVIPVGVSYNCDPEDVRDLLISVAKDCDLVLGFPEPSVAFVDFGASSLDFSLRCFVSDVNSSLSAKTALRFEIFKRFKERGIEIPFPQQDIHLRDLDGVRSMLTRIQEQRMREEQAAQARTVPDSDNPDNDNESGNR